MSIGSQLVRVCVGGIARHGGRSPASVATSGSARAMFVSFCTDCSEGFHQSVVRSRENQRVAEEESRN